MIKINEKRFREVFGLIFEAYRHKRGIFSIHVADSAGPQHIFRPKKVPKGSPDHLYWLALVAMSDRRTNSMTLYRNFARMFDRNPTLFRRGYIPTLRRMTYLFRKYQIALPVKEIWFFMERKRHLDLLAGGDPLRIYQGARNVAELLKNMRQHAANHGIKNPFPGAKEKIFCLLAMFLRDLATLEFDDVVPVDVWVQAVSASTLVLTGNGHIKVQALEKRLRPLLTAVFTEYRIVEGAANATWILGKFGCNHCVGKDMSKRCPVYDLCKGPFERMRHHKSGKHLGAIQVPPAFKKKAKTQRPA